MRIGHGYDVHRLVAGRPLILGGVKLEYELGLLGHSDALLGAAALGDIGKHFPDSDPRYKGADSLRLAKNVSELLRENGYRIVNIDSTVIAQRPKLSPFIPKMRENIASALGVSSNLISVKATTEEGLGFTGSGEGIAAHAVCLIEAL